MNSNYHERPEWSYSSMKKIIDSGVDYAVAEKRGMLGGPQSQAIDMGQLVHMLVLGGDDTFAISEFADFRTKAAREWRDEQITNGKNIITQTMFREADQIVQNIENHPHSSKYLFAKGTEYEREMYAKADGVDIRGKADAIKIKGGVLTDLKTTAQFDKFARAASWSHYDLQAAVYSMIAASFAKEETNLVDFHFCVAETVAPYRVKYFHAGTDFLEAGERKLRNCIDAIKGFGEKDPNFLIEEIGELGDMSL